MSNTTLSALMRSDNIADTVLAGLPPWLDREQFTRACVAAFADGAFDGVHPREQLRAVLKCAELGVLPGAHGHIAFVPRGNKLNPEVMYRGYVYLAEQQPGVRKVTPHIVHTSDPFEAVEAGPDRWVVTKHGRKGGDPFAPRAFTYRKGIKVDQTGLRGGYVEIEHDDGSITYHVIPADRILQNMAASKTDRISSAWAERFYRKTVIRAAWADGVFSSGSSEATARGLALRQFDIGAEKSTVRAAPALTVENIGGNAPQAPAEPTEAPQATLPPPEADSGEQAAAQALVGEALNHHRKRLRAKAGEFGNAEAAENAYRWALRQATGRADDAEVHLAELTEDQARDAYERLRAEAPG